MVSVHIAPVLMGEEYLGTVSVFRDVTKATYEDMLSDQIRMATEKKGPGDLEKLINSGDTWVIE